MGGARGWGSWANTSPWLCSAGVGTSRDPPGSISARDLCLQGRIWSRFPEQQPLPWTVLTEAEPQKKGGDDSGGPSLVGLLGSAVCVSGRSGPQERPVKARAVSSPRVLQAIDSVSSRQGGEGEAWRSQPRKRQSTH